MKEDNIKSGSKGESIACGLLEKKGYRIIKRNFRFGRGEIDIIAKKDEMLIFVEVKSKSNKEYGEPEYAVTKSKQKQIIKIARAYLYENNITDIQCRFDVIAISYENYSDPKINHIENAFIDM
jgi:putative endonuclease